MKEVSEIKGELKEDHSKIIADDDLCVSIMGCNMEELAHKIIANKDGEFDRIFLNRTNSKNPYIKE